MTVPDAAARERWADTELLFLAECGCAERAVREAGEEGSAERMVAAIVDADQIMHHVSAVELRRMVMMAAGVIVGLAPQDEDLREWIRGRLALGWSARP